MLHPQSLSPESSRTWFWLFCIVVGGFLTITVASAMGENVERQLLLAAVFGLFLVSGSLLGLLAAYQVCQTHLPEASGETAPVTIQASETKTDTLPRGLQGLLAGSQRSVISKNRPGKSSERMS